MLQYMNQGTLFFIYSFNQVVPLRSFYFASVRNLELHNVVLSGGVNGSHEGKALR